MMRKEKTKRNPMSAQLMKGLTVAQKIREEVRQQALLLREQHIIPTLQVLLVGDDSASLVYAESKAKVGAPLGIEVKITAMPTSSTQAEVYEVLQNWRKNPLVHGILVELPLPAHLDKFALLSHISPLKDVDGMHPLNFGYSLAGFEDKALAPATPLACMKLLEHYNINLRGKRVVLVGRGDTVGRPLIGLLLKRDATLTICHSRTQDLARHCRDAQVLIAAVGAPDIIKADMLSDGVVVLDAGINPTPDGAGICGDVEAAAAAKASFISPVPGGVGSLTTTVIMDNLIKAIKLQQAAGRL